MVFTRRNLLAASAAGAAGLGGAGAARAQGARWGFATPYQDTNFHTKNVRAFVEDVQKATNGALQIQLHTNGSLLPMPQIKRGVQQGQVQLGEILISAYGNEDPFFEVDGVPLLAPSFEASVKLAQLARPYIEARFQRTGLSILYNVPWPPGGFYSNARIDSLDALRGTRFRTFNTMTNRFAALVGANPTLVQASEVPQAFATGVINGMVTSAATGVDTQAWDYCKVFTPVNFTYTNNIVFVRRRDFEALPAAQRTAVQEAAQAAQARGLEMSRAAEKEAQDTLAARGLKIEQPSQALRDGLSRISATMTEEWAAKAGEDGKKLVESYRAG
ncbi:TRAP-type C4-dicarboxylate transport system, substrate-binding protein [Roseomonas rosea]|uniref:TRAP-type C4-dicarboxylate transport system, substrate-binding protein n=1 Tax=Muricoccus roseus TaxID=198092 RepID=A0A1M6QRL0_9PROT|nr:TRAP transporter substrate-binding protein [Roseomonas rosea]SHK22748.1 TRAP-type C4-dicarboxylate transport system, substrate-binding protein [Roseomonas rosea]